jgi:hypothetical protein
MDIDVGKIIGIALALTALVVGIAAIRMTRRERIEEETAEAAPVAFVDAPKAGEDGA